MVQTGRFTPSQSHKTLHTATQQTLAIRYETAGIVGLWSMIYIIALAEIEYEAEKGICKPKTSSNSRKRRDIGGDE